MFPRGIVNGSISENTKYRKKHRFQEMGMIQSELMEGPKAPYVLGALWLTHFLAAQEHRIYGQTQKGTDYNLKKDILHTV